MTTSREDEELRARDKVAFALAKVNERGITITGADLYLAQVVSDLVAARLQLEIERGNIAQPAAAFALPRPPVQPRDNPDWDGSHPLQPPSQPPTYSDRDIEMFARGMHSEGRPSYHWANASDAVKHAYISVAKQRLGIVFDGRGRPGEPRA